MLDIKISNDILKNINLNIKNGEKISIIGKNGSGKTTLLRCIIGLEKYNGEIFFNNEKIDDLKPHERANKGIGYIMQEIPNYIGIKIKDYFLKITNLKENIIEKEFQKIGLDWNLYKERYFDSKLSGGEKKKIEIVINFLLNRKIYLLDEIENSLDIIGKNYIKEFIKNSKKTFIIVSHNKDIIDLSNKIFKIEKGILNEV